MVKFCHKGFSLGKGVSYINFQKIFLEVEVGNDQEISLVKIKIFLVNPKQIATQMFLGFLWRYTLPRQHTKSIPKSENMKFDFFFVFSGVRFDIFCYSKHSSVCVIYCEFASLLCIFYS